MLSTVLPWEWILENVLDLKEFSLPCLKELIDYVPHIEDPRCSKLLQKVALRYLEEIVLTRKVDLCAVTLIRYILKSQSSYNLRRIHSLKESVESDLILRVETEVVLAILREQSGDGGRDWEAFQDAVEEIFPEGTSEASKTRRREELISISLVNEHQEDLCKGMLRNFPLDDLLKDLLQFIEQKKTLLKTKFLDQLAKDVHGGSYIPSATSLLVDKEPLAPTFNDYHFWDSAGKYHVAENILSGSKQASRKGPQTKTSLGNSRREELAEGDAEVLKEASADVHTDETTSPIPVIRRTDTEITGHEDTELQLLNKGDRRTSGLYGISVPEDLREEMCMRMAEVDKVASGLTAQIIEFVDDLEKFTADIDKGATNSNEEGIKLADAVAGQEEQRTDASSFGVNVDGPMKRPATDVSPGVTKKLKFTGTGNSLTGKERENEERCQENPKVLEDDTFLNSQQRSSPAELLQSPVPSEGVTDTSQTPLYKLSKPYLSQTRHVEFSRSTTSEQLAEQLGARESNTRCHLCRRGGVLLSCRRCPVSVHELCLEELDMGKPVGETFWFCPCCVGRFSLDTLERAKAEADTAVKNAATFLRGERERLDERHPLRPRVDRIDQGTGSTPVPPVLHKSTPSLGVHGQVSEQEAQAKIREKKQGPNARVRKEPEECLSPPSAPPAEKRYHLRPRVAPLLNLQIQTSLSPDQMEGSTMRKVKTTEGISGEDGIPESGLRPPEPALLVPASTPEIGKSRLVTSETVDTSAASKDASPKHIPTDCFVEGDAQTSCSAHNCSDEGQRADKHETHDMGVELPGHGVPSTANQTPINNVKPGVDDGDGHDGDLEEDVNRQIDNGARSKEGQAKENSVATAERTPPRRGRYRGRWKIPGVRRKNLPWSECEVAVLREGVKRYSTDGWGFHWKSILEFGYGSFDPSRTTVDLKDKWRNLNKCHDRSSSSDVSS